MHKYAATYTIRAENNIIGYVVNSAAALSRSVSSITERPGLSTRFASGATGFSLLSASPDSLVLHMIDAEGSVLQSVVL